MTTITQLSALEIAKLVKSGHVSAREVAQAHLDHIAETEPTIQAINQLTPELAFEAADKVDAAIASGKAADLGPLAGAPVGFKDNLNLIGTKTTCSSNMLKNYESVFDATAARRLVDAGMLPLAKLNMDEFAFGSSTETSAFGPTKNPWDTERVPGGSSGGSAAAVASNMVAASLGSDTGGSIRQPGSFNGLYGLKPTYGRVSRSGCVSFASSLDQIGPLTKTLEDNIAVFSAIEGYDPLDATSINREKEDYFEALKHKLKGLKVAIPTKLLELGSLDPEIKARLYEAADKLALQGVEIGEVDLPHAELGISAYYVLGPAEVSSNMARFDGVRYGHRSTNAQDIVDLYMNSRGEGFGLEVQRRLLLGTYLLSAGNFDKYFVQAQKVRTLIKQDFKKAFTDFDAILSPSTPSTAFKFGEKNEDPLDMYFSDIYTVPSNLAGNVALQLPAGLSNTGLPIGLQLVGDQFAEKTVFTLAAALDREYGRLEI